MMEDFRIFDGELVRYTGDGGDVVIPEGVERIGEYAFCKCQNLTSVTVPYGCKYICEKAFCLCDNLEKVFLPAGIMMEYGEDAYYNMVGSKYGKVDSEIVSFTDFHNNAMLICSVDVLNTEEERGMRWGLHGFLESFFGGTASEERVDGWKEYIKGNLKRCVSLLRDNAEFYRFVSDNILLSAEEIEQLLENTESLECRAMLLKKRMNK